MDRSPNEEQRVAIEHSGNMLLRAGAGSGKTYVLVEHINYLVGKFLEQHSSFDIERFNKEIRKYLSGIVVITFTRAAAGELFMRVRDRLMSNLEGDELSTDLASRWKAVVESYNYINISTIHGFCHKLLSLGYFPDMMTPRGLMEGIERKRTIKKLFDNWYGQARHDRVEDDVFNIIAKDSRGLLDAIISIFDDSRLRMRWKDFEPNSVKKQQLSEFIGEYFTMQGWDAFLKPHGLPIDDADREKSWGKYLVAFNKMCSDGDRRDFDWLTRLQSFFANYESIPNKPRAKNISAAGLQYFENVTGLKKFLGNEYESLQAFEKNREQFFNLVSCIYSAFNYIDGHLGNSGHISYADMEYYVALGLRNEAIANKVSSDFSYVIVDEFQDTSKIQYEIIKRIAGSVKNIFCVGDEKQAIYGFRGGDITVFSECAKEISQACSLKVNYRSSSSVIEFNNLLFDFILTSGRDFKGSRVDNVPMIHQVPSSDGDNRGVVVRTTVDLTDAKISGNDRGKMNNFEADAIMEVITNIRAEEPDADVAVLYRKIAPAKLLVGRLLDNKISFKAKIKSPSLEDPAVGIYKVMLEYYLLYQEGESFEKILSRYPCFVIESYLNFLGASGPEGLEAEVVSFVSDVKTYGFRQAYYKFLCTIGIAASCKSGMELIASLHDLAGDDLEEAYSLLVSDKTDNNPVELNSGDGRFRVTIMTVHGSKGLEFDHVVLGGIHTNGRTGAQRSDFGKELGSFKWKARANQSKKFTSPNYLLEQDRTRMYEEAESRRLFYVACTRAKKSLRWIDMNGAKGPLQYSSESWVVGIRNWMKQGTSELDEVGLVTNEGKVQSSGAQCSQEGGNISGPLFHIGNTGLTIHDHKTPLVILPSMSVTSLSTIVECPRKFYLKNVCKFDDYFNVDINIVEKHDNEYDGEDLSSGRGRGSMVHELISKMIIAGGDIENRDLGQRDIAALSWVKESLRPYSDSGAQFKSELPIRFSLYGQMISGIIDLVILSGSGGSELKIWDFKTGRSGQEKESSYWFQLLCYAYALAKSRNIPLNDKITIALAYVDEGKLVEREMSVAHIDEQIKPEWLKLRNLDQVNLDHCANCSYNNLCSPTLRPR